MVMDRVRGGVRDRVRDRDMGKVRDRVSLRGLAIADPRFIGVRYIHCVPKKRKPPNFRQ